MHTSDAIYSITSLTTAVKKLLENGFPFVWVRGQVANLSRPSSGHIYFTLKDEYASLNAIWFKNAQQPNNSFDPLTGEVYEDGPRPSLATTLQNGQEIICAGKLTVYPQRGVYQIVVELAQDAGMGALHIQFEYLCKKLREAGYFDEARKRPIPQNPARVAVVTAPTGAAIHDFLRTAETRGLGSTITVYPALMQGDLAPAQIIAQMNAINAGHLADVIVLIRGGGSLEDLQAFNNEEVATAVKDSVLPVLAGIGHEVDFTLADMTADKRASTPTQAAHILWSDRREMHHRLSAITARLEGTERKYFAQLNSQLTAMQRFIAVRSPYYRLQAWQQQFSSLFSRLNRIMKTALTEREHDLQRYNRALGVVSDSLKQKNAHIQELTKQLEYCKERYFGRKTADLEKTLLLLDGKNPLQPLQRGYALVRTADGKLIHSVRPLKARDELHVTLADGSLTTTIKTITLDTVTTDMIATDTIATDTMPAKPSIRKKK